MKPCAFDLHRPREIEEVLDLLARHGDDAKILAGGQSLVPLMNLRMATPAHLIDINRVEALAGIREMDSGLEIGAATRQERLLDDPRVFRCAPLLAEAARWIGHVQTRSRSTVGGSLAHADPAAELPLVMVVLDARLTVRSAREAREVSARHFFRGPLETALEPDELLTAIRIPPTPGGSNAAFVEFARRHGDFAIAAAAAQYDPARGRLVAAVGGVAPTPRIVDAFDTGTADGPFDRAQVEARAADALAAIEPLSDYYAGAEYRRHLGAVALTDSIERVIAA